MTRRERIVRAAAALAGAYVAFGAAAVVALLLAAPFVAAALRRRTAAARATSVDEALPGFVDAVAAGMRAGAGLVRAVVDADAPPPLDEALASLTTRLSVGAPLEDALEAFAETAGTEQARTVCAALAVGYRSGGDVPRMLDVLAAAARDQRRAQREARVASAQARLSAWVVASLPVVFLVMTTATSKEQARMLTRTPAGWALLAAGGALEAAGILWMRRIAAR